MLSIMKALVEVLRHWSITRSSLMGTSTRRLFEGTFSSAARSTSRHLGQLTSSKVIRFLRDVNGLNGLKSKGTEGESPKWMLDFPHSPDLVTQPRNLNGGKWLLPA